MLLFFFLVEKLFLFLFIDFFWSVSVNGKQWWHKKGGKDSLAFLAFFGLFSVSDISLYFCVSILICSYVITLFVFLSFLCLLCHKRKNILDFTANIKFCMPTWFYQGRRAKRLIFKEIFWIEDERKIYEVRLDEGNRSWKLKRDFFGSKWS